MKRCLNCNKIVKDKDNYCRNCGIEIKKNSYYILMNVITFFAIMFLVLVIALFISSYFAY